MVLSAPRLVPRWILSRLPLIVLLDMLSHKLRLSRPIPHSVLPRPLHPLRLICALATVPLWALAPANFPTVDAARIKSSIPPFGPWEAPFFRRSALVVLAPGRIPPPLARAREAQ